MSAKSSANRYGSVAITIHWASALLIVLLLATGMIAGAQTSDTATAALLRVHVPLGIAALILTVLRVLWWIVADRRPAPPKDQPTWQRFLASAVHLGLYLVILVTAASGIATLALSGAMPAILAGTTLPDLSEVPARLAHGLAARLMLALLALHIGAALYHHFVRRDHLLARMGLGSSVSGPPHG